MVGVYQIVRYLLDEGKAVPGRYIVEALICGDLVRMEWEFVHWSAMMQGVVYSWRILRQLLQLVKMESEQPPALQELLAFINTLPSILDLFPVKFVEVDEIGMKDILDGLYGLLDIKEEYTVVPVVGQSRKRKRKKRDGKQKVKGSTSSLTKTLSTNMFSLLTEIG